MINAACRDLGADLTVNYAEILLTRRDFTQGAGINVILDMVGGDYMRATWKPQQWAGASSILPTCKAFRQK